MTTELEEIKKTSAEVAKAFSELQTELKSAKDTDALQNQKIDRLVEAVTKGSESVQKLEAKQTAIETALKRVDEAKAKESDSFLAEQKKAFIEYMRHGQLPEGVKNANAPLEIKALRSDINPNGGYLVIPEMAAFTVGRNFETSPMRQLARVVTTSSNAIQAIIDDDEATATWVAQGSPSSNTTTPEVGLATIHCHKLDAEPRTTTEMLQDAIMDVEGWLREKLNDKFGRAENTAFISGNGVARPRGILTYSAWAAAGTYERDKIEQINSGATATLTANGLIDLQNGLKEAYQARAAFLMKRATFGAILKLKGSDNYYFSISLLKDGQLQKQLLGKPVVLADDMEAVAANALAVAYGDFSVGYTIVDKAGLEVLRDPYSNKGFVTFYSTKRVGGQVTNFDAIKIQKCAV